MLLSPLMIQSQFEYFSSDQEGPKMENERRVYIYMQVVARSPIVSKIDMLI